jgi:hypothetical protein
MDVDLVVVHGRGDFRLFGGNGGERHVRSLCAMTVFHINT